MADDDVAAERARLEALAWGADTSPTEAARARIALQELQGRGRRTGGSGPSTARQPGGATPDTTSVPSHAGSAPTVDTGIPQWPVAPGGRPDGRLDGPAAADGRDVRGGVDGDHPREAAGPGGDGPGLQADVVTWRTRAARILNAIRPRVWIGLGAAAAVGVAFAAGTIVGTARPDPAAAPSITPTPGSVTLEELLDAPQTYADQLPGPVGAPVSLHSTRLIFSNRALDGSTFDTPWAVWAGVGTDRSTICLVATANRIESTSACYPREAALHGSVSLSAQSMSGTLTMTVRGGGVQGTVTNEN